MNYTHELNCYVSSTTPEKNVELELIIERVRESEAASRRARKSINNNCTHYFIAASYFVDSVPFCSAAVTFVGRFSTTITSLPFRMSTSSRNVCFRVRNIDACCLHVQTNAKEKLDGCQDPTECCEDANTCW